MPKISDVLDKAGRKIEGASIQTPPPDAGTNGGRRPAPPQQPQTQPGEPSPASDREEEARLEIPKRSRLRPRRVGGAGVERERLVSQYAPGSPEGKRIDILRSQLLYPFHGDPPRIIMVTSAVPQEGRSLLTANLAISFARGLQQYVMIMDCHLRHPTIHSLLGVPRRPGLSDYLEHGSTVPEIMHWSLVDKLSVIPAGSPSYRSAELLATDRMAALMEELRARYADRYILLDTPPVEAVDDPAVLARMVEGIVFVVLPGSTEREVSLRALSRLPEDKIIGVVMNDKFSAVSDATAVASHTLQEVFS